MDALYLTLLITSLAMSALLILMFFDVRLKTVMSVNLYNRAFAAVALLAVAGILLSSSLGFTNRHHQQQARVISAVKQAGL
jgi:hypothetical protein